MTVHHVTNGRIDESPSAYNKYKVVHTEPGWAVFVYPGSDCEIYQQHTPTEAEARSGMGLAGLNGIIYKYIFRRANNVQQAIAIIREMEAATVDKFLDHYL